MIGDKSHFEVNQGWYRRPSLLMDRAGARYPLPFSIEVKQTKLETPRSVELRSLGLDYLLTTGGTLVAEARDFFIHYKISGILGSVETLSC